MALPQINFTHKKLNSIKPDPEKRIEYWDQSMNGRFGLRVFPSGKKSWVVLYRANQVQKRFTIGKYDDIPLVEARDKAKEILHSVATGKDPQSKKVEDRHSMTFHNLADEYIEKYAKINKRSWKEDQRILNKDILPLWKNLKASKVKRRDVLLLLDSLLDRGAPILANRVLALVRKVFNFGIEREILEFNPCTNVKRPVDEKSRQGQRVLTFDEIRKVWKAIEGQNNILIAGIFKIRILTAQRGIEVRSMKWEDVDLESKIWTIPSEIVKNKLQHRVPLSPQAIKVLKEIKSLDLNSQYVFASPTSQQIGYINNIGKAVSRVRELSKVQFVDRDLRRTVGSHMTGELGVSRLLVSKILNHSEAGITQIYDRHSYDNEKREALISWGKKIVEIISHV